MEVGQKSPAGTEWEQNKHRNVLYYFLRYSGLFWLVLVGEVPTRRKGAYLL